jgi:DNA-3-methyladenine glycosylase
VKKISRAFYLDDDVVAISKALLGKVLCTRIDGSVTRVVITETEAYAGVTDKASHAYGDRRTKRTEPMYGPAGAAYVYLCYGIHHLFNVVTNKAGIPHAVLIRAGAAVEGVETMLARRNKKKVDKTLLAGPGSLAKALGITTQLTGTSLVGNKVWIEDHDINVEDDQISARPRVGVDYAEEDAKRLYRFSVAPEHLIGISQGHKKA